MEMKKIIFLSVFFFGAYSQAGICGWSNEVYNAIKNQLAVSKTCENITDADLATITELNLGKHYDNNNPPGVYYDENSFPNLKNLKKLTFWDNFTTLSGAVFKNLPSLQELDFSWVTELRGLETVTSNGLSKVQKLNLSSANLSVAPVVFFEGMPELRELNLSYNKFDSVPTEAISKLTKLETLYFDGNPVNELKSDSFLGLTNLNALSISYVKLERVHSFAFRGLGNLNKLKMVFRCYDQKCTTVFEDDSFGALNRLEVLAIGGEPNQVDRCACDLSFGPNAFRGLNKLKKLSLKSTVKSGFDSKLFAGLQSLESLDLRHNEIRLIDAVIFEELVSLKSLNSSSNRIQSISPGSFKNLAHLRDLDLSDSGGPLTLTENTFKGLISLENLNLFYAGVALQGRVFAGMSQLKYLDISTNFLSQGEKEQIKLDLPNTEIRF